MFIFSLIILKIFFPFFLKAMFDFGKYQEKKKMLKKMVFLYLISKWKKKSNIIKISEKFIHFKII